MSVDLNALWDRLPDWKEEQLGEMVRKAKSGDVDEVWNVACALQQGQGIERNLPLAKELFQWLVEQGYEEDEADVIQLNHLMDPSLPYTAVEIKKCLGWCRKDYDYVFMFGMVVKAIQSDDQLFHRFKAQVMQAYKRLLLTLDDVDIYLDQWHAVLVLDERMHSGEDEIQAALSVLSDTISSETDADVAIQYLEYAIRRNQRDQLSGDFSAIECLKSHGCVEEVNFYSGLAALCEADYAQAYTSFCQSESKRCRLGQAYCLIHGMGTPIDHQQAREILKAYPDDAFALYLLAVSLYRTRTSTEIPSEVKELLEESYQMGYKPADTTRLLMELAYSDHEEESYLDELMRKIVKKVEKTSSDAEAVGALLFLCCHKVLRFYYDIDPEGDKADDLREITDRAEGILNRHYTCVSPLAAYVRALCRQTFSDTYRMEDWLKGLNGFNQSPEVRAWAVGMAVVQSWRYEDEFNYTPLLGYYLKFVGENTDLPILCAYMSTRLSRRGVEVIVELFRGLMRLLQGLAEKSPFAKILIAFLQAMDLGGEKDPELIRQYLTETADVKGPFLLRFRNQAIVAAHLEQELGIIEPVPELNEFEPEWLNNFIGYAFMDYTA